MMTYGVIWIVFVCMQYGFTSFVHRDHAYKVLQLIWQNSQLQQVPHDLKVKIHFMFLVFVQPSSHDALRNQLTHLFTAQHQLSPLAQRAKSLSFSSDNTALPSPNHSRSNSFPSTPNTSDTLAQPHRPHLLVPSDSDVGTESDDMITPREQVDGAVLSRLQVEQFGVTSSSSSCKSGSEEEEEATVLNFTPSSTDSLQQLQQSSDGELSRSSDSSLIHNAPIPTEYSPPSTLKLRPPVTEAPVQAQALLGGSPNFLHHWKRTLSVRTVWQTVVTVTKPQHLIQLCTPSRLINMLIIFL